MLVLDFQDNGPCVTVTMNQMLQGLFADSG